MKIGNVKLQHIKNLALAEFDFEGQSAMILGKNGQGKSTMIQMIEMAIYESLKIDNPIMSGKDKGEGVIEFIDDKGNKYYAHLEFKKNKNGKVTTKYVLKGEDGGEFQKKDHRNNLFGARFKFDATEFVSNQSTASGRRKNLANVICPALGISIDDVKGNIDDMIESRKGLKREIKTYDDMFKARGVELSEVEVGLEQTNIEELQKRYEEATEQHSKLQNANEIIASSEAKRKSHIEAAEQYDVMAENTWNAKKDAIQDKIRKHEAHIEQIMGYIREEMDNLEKIKNKKPEEVINLENKAQEEREKAIQVVNEANELSASLESGENPDLPDPEVLKEELNAAILRNNRVETINAMKGDLDQMNTLKRNLDRLEEDISKYKVEKGEFLKQACIGKLPEGYVIQLDEKYDPTLYYKVGDDLLIFDDSQINTAKVMTGAVVLGMELLRESKIQVITISRAESLDKDTREMIMEECNKRGFQVIMERVDDDSDLTVEIITEDGQDK